MDISKDAALHYPRIASVYRGMASKHFIFINPNNLHLSLYDVTTLKKVKEIGTLRPFLEELEGFRVKLFEVKSTTPYFMDDKTLCLNIGYFKRSGKQSKKARHT